MLFLTVVVVLFFVSAAGVAASAAVDLRLRLPVLGPCCRLVDTQLDADDAEGAVGCAKAHHLPGLDSHCRLDHVVDAHRLAGKVLEVLPVCPKELQRDAITFLPEIAPEEDYEVWRVEPSKLYGALQRWSRGQGMPLQGAANRVVCIIMLARVLMGQEMALRGAEGRVVGGLWGVEAHSLNGSGLVGGRGGGLLGWEACRQPLLCDAAATSCVTSRSCCAAWSA